MRDHFARPAGQTTAADGTVQLHPHQRSRKEQTMSSYRSFSLVIAVTTLLFCTPEQTRAQTAGSEGYGAFRLMRSRNIFDPERRSSRSDAPPPQRSESRSSRSN